MRKGRGFFALSKKTIYEMRRKMITKYEKPDVKVLLADKDDIVTLSLVGDKNKDDIFND